MAPSSREKLKVYDQGVVRNTETFGEFQLTYRSGDVLSPHLEASEPLMNQARAFVNSIPKRSALAAVRTLGGAALAVCHLDTTVRVARSAASKTQAPPSPLAWGSNVRATACVASESADQSRMRAKCNAKRPESGVSDRIAALGWHALITTPAAVAPAFARSDATGGATSITTAALGIFALAEVA